MIPIAARDTPAAGDRSCGSGRGSWRMLAGALLASVLLGCGSSSPVDMWIAKDPDAGAGFVAPIREAGTDGADAADDSGAAGDNGNAGAGGSAGGTTGSGGNAGAGGSAAGTTGSGGNAGAGGNAAGGAAGA